MSTTGSGDTTREDAFPSTRYTLLGRLLREGPEGVMEARRHIMEVYEPPLRTYYAGTSFYRNHRRELGEVDDVVRGFFADRLSRDHFLYDWLLSRRPLRFWLITALKHHLFEQLDAKARHDRDRRARPARVERDDGPEAAYHRELALWMVREAVRRGQERCEANRRAEHWRIAMDHQLRGRRFRELGEELGLSEQRVKVMARTGANAFKAALREVVAWPGATPPEIDREIRDLMEAMRR